MARVAYRDRGQAYGRCGSCLKEGRQSSPVILITSVWFTRHASTSRARSSALRRGFAPVGSAWLFTYSITLSFVAILAISSPS
jgi:hypothetical protein